MELARFLLIHYASMQESLFSEHKFLHRSMVSEALPQCPKIMDDGMEFEEVLL